MIVIPAIDLRGGKCVRMERGDPSTSVVYDDDPIDRAKAFVKAGARRLHVIDLDGAFGSGENNDAIARICRAVDVPVQTGGGIRTADQAKARVAAGAAEVILGTLLIEEERVARNIIGQLGDRVIAGIDARGKMVATRGWQESTPVDRDSLVKRIALWGIARVIFTEISRDGMGEGYDIDALHAVSAAAPVKIIASGGARTIDDIRQLKSKAPVAVDSCIIGSALYKGSLDLAEAIAAVS